MTRCSCLSAERQVLLSFELCAGSRTVFAKNFPLQSLSRSGIIVEDSEACRSGRNGRDLVGVKKRLIWVIVCLYSGFVCLCSGCIKTEPPSSEVTAPVTASKSTALSTVTPSVLPSFTPDRETPSSTAAPTLTQIPLPTATPIKTIPPGKGTYSKGIASSWPTEAYFYNVNKSDSVPLQVYTDVSIQFFATTTFDGVQVACPSYSDNIGTLTFTLYAWAGTFQLTRQGKMIRSETFVDFRDNQTLRLDFPTPLPDGEYLLVISTPRYWEGVGMWMKDEPFAQQRVFVEDIIFEDLSTTLTVLYTNTPNRLYGPLSAPW